MPAPSYLAKNRHGAFIFRIKIPVHLRPLFAGKKVITKSLQTYHRPTALKAARGYAAKADELFYKLEMKKEYIFKKTILKMRRSAARAHLSDLEFKLSPEALRLLEQEGASTSPELDAFIANADRINENIRSTEHKINKLDKKIRIVEIMELRDSIVADQSVLIAEAMDLFVESKAEEDKELAKNTQKIGNWAGYTPHLRLFISVVGNKRTREITLADLHKYKKLVPNMPRSNVAGMSKLLTFNQTNFCYDTPLDEIIERSKEMGVPRIAEKTIADYYSYISTFITWAASEHDYISNDIMLKAQHILSTKKATASEENKAKSSYNELSTEQLSKLFNSKFFIPNIEPPQKGRQRGYNAADFWIPLIALFTGARASEMAKLRTCDIKFKADNANLGEAWHFDINTEELRVKNKSSIRIVPIHKELIRIGLLDYHQEMISQKSEKLFPKLWATQTGQKKPYKKWGDWFRENVMKDVLGTTPYSGDVFHSFRDTLSTELYRQGVEEDTRKKLVGHAGDVHSLYIKGLRLPELRDTINKAEYPGLDLSQISWENYKKAKLIN